jgi:hypothetical protein
MDEMAEKCNKASVPFGVSMGVDQVSITDWIRRGISWIGAGGDTGYIAQAGSDTIKLIKGIDSKK